VSLPAGGGCWVCEAMQEVLVNNTLDRGVPTIRSAPKGPVMTGASNWADSQCGGHGGKRHDRPADGHVEPTNPGYGPVVKLQWLAALASSGKSLSRLELAVCVILADMANSNTGVSWPSFNRLATRAGSSTRGAKMAVRKLVEQGIIEIVHPGSRTRSNRYRIRIESLREARQAVEGGEEGFTTPRSEGGFTRVVKSNVEGGEAGMPDVVNPASPESVYESERKRRNEIDRSQADGGALALGPRGPSLARQPNGNQLRYPQFWQALGRRVNVFKSEALIDGLLDGGGVEYAEIVEGAKRWRRYTELVKSKRVLTPEKWLEQRKWLDDWEPPRIAAKAGPSAEDCQKNQPNPPEEAKWQAVYSAWRVESDRKEGSLHECLNEVDRHFDECDACKEALKQRDAGMVCEFTSEQALTSKVLQASYNSWRAENPPPKRDLSTVSGAARVACEGFNELTARVEEADQLLNEHLVGPCEICSPFTSLAHGDVSSPLLCEAGRKLALAFDAVEEEKDEYWLENNELLCTSGVPQYGVLLKL